MAQEKYIVNSSHAEDLASGQTVAPGEKLTASAVNEKDEHDKRLLKEGVILPLGGKTEGKSTGGSASKEDDK